MTMREKIEAIRDAIVAADNYGCEFDCCCSTCSAVGNVDTSFIAALAEADSVYADYQRAREAYSQTGSFNFEMSRRAFAVLDAYFSPSGEG